MEVYIFTYPFLFRTYVLLTVKDMHIMIGKILVCEKIKQQLLVLLLIFFKPRSLTLGVVPDC